MEITVNIVDTLFDSIPKGTVVANYVTEVETVNFKMYSTVYSIDETNKAIVTTKKVDANNLEAIHFDAINWVTTDKATIDNIYPKVVSKYLNKFKKEGVIYKITKDYDLDGSTLIIPVGCTLDFLGGSFANGTLQGHYTKIKAPEKVIFKSDIIIDGDWDILDIYDEWFEFDPTPEAISNNVIKNILALSNDNINNTIHFEADRTYYFELPYKGRANLGDDVRPDYWKLNTEEYAFLRIFTGVTSNSHLIFNNTLQMIPTNQGAYFIFHIENKENIKISGIGTINGDAKDHLYTDPFAGDDYYGEWGHVLNFRSCNNVVIRDITVGYAFGDGIALGNAAYNNNGTKAAGLATRNVTVDGVKVLYARRNGICVGGNNYSITNVYFEGNGSDAIRGTAPMAAIDFENDYVDIEPSGLCKNVSMSDCKFKDNKHDVSSTIRDDLYEVPRGELVNISDCNFTSPLRLNRTNGLTFSNCHIVGITNIDNSIAAWYASKDLVFSNCIFDELNPYLAISAEEQNKKFINPTYPEDIRYTTTFQLSMGTGGALKFTIPKPLVGEVEFTALCSNPNYSAVQMPINTTIYTFGPSQRLTGIRDVKTKSAQDSTPRYGLYKYTPVFSYINYAEDADNFIIYFAIGGDLINDPLGGNTSVNIFLTSKTKFITIQAPVSERPEYAGMYGGKWSQLSAIIKESIAISDIPEAVTFPSKEIYEANLLADMPDSLTPDKVGKSVFILDTTYKRPAFWDSYSNVFRTADGNRLFERRVTSQAELNDLTAKLNDTDRGYVVFITTFDSYLTWDGIQWINEDGSLFSEVKFIKRTETIDILNVLFSYSNVIYKITGVIDLGNGELTIASGCTLDFQGGSISNGTINCNNTIINGLHIFSDVVLTGNYNEGTTHTDLFIIDDDITQVLTTLLNDDFCEIINVNGDFQFNPVNVNLTKNKKLNINGTITLTSTFNINRSIEINGIGVNAGIQFGKPTGGIFTESEDFEGEDLFCVTGSARKVFNNISLKSKNSITIRLSYDGSNIGALFEFNDVQFYSENNYCVYIDNVFWVWFNRCIIYSITSNNIYIYSRGTANSYAGLIKIYDSIFAFGNIKIDSTVGGNIDIKDCTHESLKEGESLIEVINGSHFCVSLDNVEIVDTSANVYIIDANDLNTFFVKNHRGEITFKTEKRPTNYSNDSAYRNTIYTAVGITFEDKGLNSGETSYGISTYKNIYRGYSPISIGAGYNISIGNRYANNSTYFTKEQVSFNGSNTAALLVNNTGGVVYPQLFSIATPEEISSKTGWVVLTCMVKRKEGTTSPFGYDWSSFSLGTITGDSSFEDLDGNASRSTPLYETYINNDSWHLAGSIIKVNAFGTYIYSNIVLIYDGEYFISKPTLKFYDDTVYTLGDVINIIKGVGYQGDKEGVGVIDNVPFVLGDIDEETTIPVGSIAYSENNLILGTDDGNNILKKINPNIVFYSNRVPTNIEDYSDGDIVYVYYGYNKGLIVKYGDNFVRWDGELASNVRQGNSSERPTEIGMNGYFYMDTQLNVPIWYNRNAWIEADGQPASILRIGTTGQRPDDANAGFQYFDTILNKPIWWTGSEWVDATGTTV